MGTSTVQSTECGKTSTEILRDLEVGQQAVFPARLCSSIKAMCSMYSFQWDRYYSTSIRRKERVIIATRIR